MTLTLEEMWVKAAVEHRIPCFTSLDTARAAVESLLMSRGNYNVQRTDEYLNGVK